MKKLLATLCLLMSLGAHADEIPQAKVDEIASKVQTTYMQYYKTPNEICAALHRVYGYTFTYEIDRFDPKNKTVRYMLMIGHGTQITYLNTFLILPYTGNE